jgi:hypothetical protein
MPAAPLKRQRRPDEFQVPLRPAPPQAPPLEEPSRIGKALGYEPTATLGSQIGRWYENAGGLGKAIDAAQQSQQSRNTRVLDGLMWPKWKPEDVTSRRPSSITRSPQYAVPNANGAWYHNSSRVWLAPDARQSVLEHELSHNAYIRDAKTGASQAAAAEQSQNWDMPHGGTARGDRAKYLAAPEEVDVRLAEIKRRYAHHAGRLVDSPEEAKKAWDWWRTYNLNFGPAGSKQVERPEDRPTLYRRDFEYYDDLPGHMKTQMLHRMPELVRTQPTNTDSIRKYAAAVRRA